MTAESTLRADIVEVGRRLYARGYTASNDGNISVRLGADRLLMTPKGVCKGFMTPDMMCITDLEGRKLQGDRDPSSEMLMHLEVYRQRQDVQAVVHAHPPTATGFAVAGIPLDRVGADLYSAYYKMETIEHFARISLVARLLGRENLISREEVMRLQSLRGAYGIKAPAPICSDETDGRPSPAEAGDAVAGGADMASCQVVRAPSSPRERLVPDVIRLASSAGEADGDAEIRLTYRELSRLIEDAVRSLR